MRALIFNIALAAIFGCVQSDISEDVPQLVSAVPLTSTAFWLDWRQPPYPTGKLTGYNIYYAEIRENYLSERVQFKHLANPFVTSIVLTGLKPDTKYQISVVATTKNGEGTKDIVVKRTLSNQRAKPAKPTFSWKQLPSKKGFVNIRIFWLPDLEGHAAHHFYVKYRLKDETEWINLEEEMIYDYRDITGLKPHKVYEFCVVSVDGNQQTESNLQEVRIPAIRRPFYHEHFMGLKQ